MIKCEHCGSKEKRINIRTWNNKKLCLLCYNAFQYGDEENIFGERENKRDGKKFRTNKEDS